ERERKRDKHGRSGLKPQTWHGSVPSPCRPPGGDYFTSLHFAHNLLARGLQQLRHMLAHAVLADLEALLLEIGDDLLHDVVVARLREVGHDDGLGIGLGLRTRNAQLLGRPQAEKPVAPSSNLELKLFVVLVLVLKPLLAVFERWHAAAPRCDHLNGLGPR